MKNWKHWTFVAIMAVFGIVVSFNACDNNNNSSPITFTVTFDSNGGTPVSSQTVEENNSVSEPVASTKTNDVAGLYAGTPPDYTFVGWYYNEIPWDFSSSVTGNIILKAKWTAPALPINVTFENNILHNVILYTSNNPTSEGYTFLLDTDMEIQLPRLDGVFNLTLIGIGEERTLFCSVDTEYILYMNNDDIKLVLGKNTLLNGRNADTGVVYLSHGTLVMQVGSKIMGYSGIETGVFVGNSGIFMMNGGKITGNSNIADLRINSSASFKLSGNAEIGNLVLTHSGSNFAVLNISDWSGSIGTLGLAGNALYDDYDIHTIINRWDNELVVKAIDGTFLAESDISRFPLGNFRSSMFGDTLAPQLISNSHKLELDTANNALKLVAK
jgi:uncharacterized repeat protein (TIGR02543 family)